MDIERLTARNKDGIAYLVNVKPDEQEVDSPHKNTLKCILDCFERLAQYEDEAIARQAVTDETYRQSDEQEAYIRELRQRLSLAEKVCYEANGYLKSKDNPLGRIYLDRLNNAVEKWDNGRPNKGAQYVVMEDWEQ